MLGDDRIGFCSPYEGLWVGVAVFDPFGNSDFELGHAVECPSSDALPCNLSEQSLDEVEPGAGCRREVEFEARMVLEPTVHGRCFVCAVIVDDQVQVEVRERFTVDFFQEHQEFPGAMERQAVTDDLAGRHIERGEQCRGSVTFVVVRHGAGAALLHGQARLGAIEGLDLALLVDGKHQGFLGRVEIEADDVLDLLGEVGIVGDLEGTNEMRLEPVLIPDALHAGVADAHLLGHGAHAPVRGVGGTFLHRFLDDLELDVGGDRLLAGRLGTSLDEAGDASLDEVLLPAPNGRFRNSGFAHDGRDAMAVSRQEHHPCALDDLLGRVPVRNNLLKLGAILRTQYDSCWFPAHAANESYSRQLRIQMSVTEY